MRCWTLSAALSPVLALATALPAADLPLGHVEQVTSDGGAVLRFDSTAATHLMPGGMVALYGSGSVEKHPLTGEVLVRRPTLVAKVQLTTALGDGRWQCRLRWQVPASAVAVGQDALPLPGEAAPNTPPVADRIAPLTVAAGDRLDITLPVRDPDGDALACRWSIEGPAGRCGIVLEDATVTPTTTWLAPLAEGRLTLVATISDPLGQSITVRQPITVSAPSALPGSTAQALGAWGSNREPGLLRWRQGPTGATWGLTAAVGMTGAPGLARLLPGGRGVESVPLAPEVALRKPVGLLDRGTDVAVLDAGRSQVSFFTPAGALVRSVGPFERAVGLASGPDGALYVADAADRGIHVLEADGRYRCRLGRGVGDDALLDIASVAVADDGTVVAVDPVRPALVRYDRFGHRLANWACPGDAKDPAIDLVLHPRLGALVLLASGKVVPVTANGLKEPLADPAVAAGELTGRGLSLTLDANGTLIGTRDGGVLVRWSGAELTPAGVRASALRTGDVLAGDGTGRCYALNRANGMVTVTDAQHWQLTRFSTGAKGAASMAVDPQGRFLVVVDRKGHCALQIDLAAPTRPAHVMGQEGTYDGQFKNPVAAAVDAQGRVYLLDSDLQRVAVFAADGTFSFHVGARKILEDPELIAVAPAGDLLYVYDSDHYEIKRFRLDHEQRSASSPSLAGGKGSGPGQFRAVVAMGCDRRGLLYVADDSRDDLQVLDFRGQACTPVHQHGLADLDLSDVAALAVFPDGQVITAGAGRWTAWRW